MLFRSVSQSRYRSLLSRLGIAEQYDQMIEGEAIKILKARSTFESKVAELERIKFNNLQIKKLHTLSSAARRDVGELSRNLNLKIVERMDRESRSEPDETRVNATILSVEDSIGIGTFSGSIMVHEPFERRYEDVLFHDFTPKVGQRLTFYFNQSIVRIPGLRADVIRGASMKSALVTRREELQSIDHEIAGLKKDIMESKTATAELKTALNKL